MFFLVMRDENEEERKTKNQQNWNFLDWFLNFKKG